MIGSGDSGGDVSEDKVVPSEQRSQPVTRGQIDSSLPFFGGDYLANCCCFCLHVGYSSTPFLWGWRLVLTQSLQGKQQQDVTARAPPQPSTTAFATKAKQ